MLQREAACSREEREELNELPLELFLYCENFSLKELDTGREDDAFQLAEKAKWAPGDHNGVMITPCVSQHGCGRVFKEQMAFLKAEHLLLPSDQ